MEHDESCAPSDRKVRVAVVDDHPFFRKGLADALGAASWIDVVGQAGTAEEAFELVSETEPDVAVLDVALPGVSGIQATRVLAESNPGCRVLIMTMSEDDQTLLSAVQAGAVGYLLKGAGQEELLQAVRAVSLGCAFYGRRSADRLQSFLAALAAAPGCRAFPTLTEREREILSLIARGYDNRRIARTLVLADKTVRNHVSNVLAKLQVTDRTEAALRAREAGLGVDE